LLAGNLFGKDSAGGFFALEPDTETVVYHCFFDLATAAQDVEEFVSAIEKILQLCELWAERLHGGAELDAGASRDTPSRNDMVFHA
ncbi:MAG: type III secretion system chaperone, partial [Kiritimatiellae bacterium]|nr:type III secretion system chaperone [Kiritimatiellia bacterium]